MATDPPCKTAYRRPAPILGDEISFIFLKYDSKVIYSWAKYDTLAVETMDTRARKEW